MDHEKTEVPTARRVAAPAPPPRRPPLAAVLRVRKRWLRLNNERTRLHGPRGRLAVVMTFLAPRQRPAREQKWRAKGGALFFFNGFHRVAAVLALLERRRGPAHNVGRGAAAVLAKPRPRRASLGGQPSRSGTESRKMRRARSWRSRRANTTQNLSDRVDGMFDYRPPALGPRAVRRAVT